MIKGIASKCLQGDQLDLPVPLPLFLQSQVGWALQVHTLNILSVMCINRHGGPESCANRAHETFPSLYSFFFSFF